MKSIGEDTKYACWIKCHLMTLYFVANKRGERIWSSYNICWLRLTFKCTHFSLWVKCFLSQFFRRYFRSLNQTHISQWYAVPTRDTSGLTASWRVSDFRFSFRKWGSCFLIILLFFSSPCHLYLLSFSVILAFFFSAFFSLLLPLSVCSISDKALLVATLRLFNFCLNKRAEFGEKKSSGPQRT